MRHAGDSLTMSSITAGKMNAWSSDWAPKGRGSKLRMNRFWLAAVKAQQTQSPVARIRKRTSNSASTAPCSRESNSTSTGESDGRGWYFLERRVHTRAKPMNANSNVTASPGAAATKKMCVSSTGLSVAWSSTSAQTMNCERVWSSAVQSTRLSASHQRLLK